MCVCVCMRVRMYWNCAHACTGTLQFIASSVCLFVCGAVKSGRSTQPFMPLIARGAAKAARVRAQDHKPVHSGPACEKISLEGVVTENVAQLAR